MVLNIARRRIRARRARRLHDRVRSQPPDRLDGVVGDLRAIVDQDDGSARFAAVEALAALARTAGDHPVGERATDALVDVLVDGDEVLREVASPEARYVALERPAVTERLDAAYAALLEDGSPAVRQQVAVDVGILVAEHGNDAALGQAVAGLTPLLLGGDEETRRAAATGYVLAAGTPTVVDDPGTIAEHLAIFQGETDDAIPPADSHLGRLAGDRTLADAIAIFRDAP